MEFTADQVWGLAVRADALNNGYIKEPKGHYTEDSQWVVDQQANKILVKQWLRDNVQPSAQEVEKGNEYRGHFKTFTMKLLTGQINDFERTALKVSQMDTFTSRNMYEFSIVSCLPDVARRDRARNEIKREIYNSEQLTGKVGDKIQGEITVVSCRFNPNYNKFRIQARMGEAFVDFWFSKALEGNVGIKGKIKTVRGDKTTQLNFVKIL